MRGAPHLSMTGTVSPPFCSKILAAMRTRAHVLLSFDWLESSHSRQIQAKKMNKKRVRTRVAGTALV